MDATLETELARQFRHVLKAKRDHWRRQGKLEAYAELARNPGTWTGPVLKASSGLVLTEVAPGVHRWTRPDSGESHASHPDTGEHAHDAATLAGIPDPAVRERAKGLVARAGQKVNDFLLDHATAVSKVAWLANALDSILTTPEDIKKYPWLLGKYGASGDVSGDAFAQATGVPGHLASRLIASALASGWKSARGMFARSVLKAHPGDDLDAATDLLCGLLDAALAGVGLPPCDPEAVKAGLMELRDGQGGDDTDPHDAVAEAMVELAHEAKLAGEDAGPGLDRLRELLDDPAALAEALRGSASEGTVAKCVGLMLVRKAWSEDKHKRDHGKFSSTGGGSGDGGKSPAKDPAKAPGDWLGSLSPAESSGVRAWTADAKTVKAFRLLSSGKELPLRSPNAPSGYTPEQAESLTADFAGFKSAIDRAPDFSGDVHRVMHNIPGGTFAPGKEFTVPAYTSTARGKEQLQNYLDNGDPDDEGHPVTMSMRLKTGADISGISSTDEGTWDEVVVRPGTRFRTVSVEPVTLSVHGVKRPGHHVTVEEVEDSVTKAFDESQHPRGRNGHFIAKGDIEAAKTDPAKAAELRDKVAPKDAAKLDAQLAAPAKGPSAGAKRAVAKERGASILAKLAKSADLRGKFTADDLHALADHLADPAVTVGHLREVRRALRSNAMQAGFGGESRKAGMVAALVEHAWGHAFEERLKEQGIRGADADEMRRAAGRLPREEPEPVKNPAAAAKDKKKTARKKKYQDTIIAKVLDYGGLDPNSLSLKGTFRNMQEAVANGVPLAVFRKGGRGLDQLAQEMESAGHISTPSHLHSTDHLLDLIRDRAHTLSADLSKKHESDLDEYYRAREEAERYAEAGELEEVRRSNEEVGRNEGQTDEVEEHGEGADPDERLDESDLPEVDDSFDFGFAEPEPIKPAPPAHRGVASLKHGVDNSPGLSDDQRARYHAAVDHVASRLPLAAHGRLANHLGGARFHPDETTVGPESVAEVLNHPGADAETKQAWKAWGDSLKERGVHAGGVYSGATGSIHADGDMDNPHPGRHSPGDKFLAHHVYAHELGHAIDGPDHEISSSPQWAHAFDSDIAHKPKQVGDEAPLTTYAAKSPSEGFAEFARLLYASDVPTDQIRREFPKASLVFNAHGLWPAERKGPESSMADVFGQRQQIKGASHADILKSGLKESAPTAATPPESSMKKLRDRWMRGADDAAPTADEFEAASRPAGKPDAAPRGLPGVLDAHAAAPPGKVKIALESALWNADAVDDSGRPIRNAKVDPAKLARQVSSSWNQLHDELTPAERDQMHAALAHAGVQVRGTAGEPVKFDGRYHEGPAGHFTGDDTTLTRPGLVHVGPDGRETIMVKGKAEKTPAAPPTPAEAPSKHRITLGGKTHDLEFNPDGSNHITDDGTHRAVTYTHNGVKSGYVTDKSGHTEYFGIRESKPTAPEEPAPAAPESLDAETRREFGEKHAKRVAAEVKKVIKENDLAGQMSRMHEVRAEAERRVLRKYAAKRPAT